MYYKCSRTRPKENHAYLTGRHLARVSRSYKCCLFHFHKLFFFSDKKEKNDDAKSFEKENKKLISLASCRMPPSCTPEFKMKSFYLRRTSHLRRDEAMASEEGC